MFKFNGKEDQHGEMGWNPCPEAKAAARWWGDQIRQGEHYDTVPYVIHDEPTRGEEQMRRAMAAHMETQRNPVPEKKIKRFQRILAMLIDTKMRDVGDGFTRDEPYDLDIGFDHHPTVELEFAARTAKLPLTATFPGKTHMSIRPGLVTCSNGYDAPARTIYQDPSRQVPHRKETAVGPSLGG
jgi:hypothetical protein